ncbi:uncharacterized protein PGTG_15487 [Puccinia graminis f. sp. tritici CRL 75-36-700-3]|uniref:Uncharacterized protein n=1 Tax=Puccinia graminis f. sp. tritici (strain CRL 75-36-700-3 / race SCCL) TaxID=418459 RepID=E3KYB7_PUCGT|nr:uncharacterized protein PGTG_15487 [Puccinia graminis f. sp. tritici CRL 75-36-700-3]EFP89308.1 hypothetical protein PGTG_15487 [Puccinia graminis f. sp. tritici CRL 75-36-700-3]
MYNASKALSALILTVVLSVLVGHSASAPPSSPADAFKKLSSSDPTNLAVPRMNGDADEEAEQARKGSSLVRHRSLDSDLLSNDDGSPPPVAQSANAPSSPNLSITAPSVGSAGGGAIKLLLHQPSPKNSFQPRRFQDDSVSEDPKQFTVAPPPDQNSQRKRHTQSHQSTSYEAGDIRPNSPKNSFQPRRFQDDSVSEDAKQFMVAPPPDQNPQRKRHTESRQTSSYEAVDLSSNSPKNSFQPRRFQDDSVSEDPKQFMVAPPPDQNPQRKRHAESHQTSSNEAVDVSRNKALGFGWH